MRRSVQLYRQHNADAVVIEANNGGDYLPAVLRAVDRTIPVRLVHATRGKKIAGAAGVRAVRAGPGSPCRAA